MTKFVKNMTLELAQRAVTHALQLARREDIRSACRSSTRAAFSSRSQKWTASSC